MGAPAYSILITEGFQKKIRRLDREVAKRILSRLYELEQTPDPRLRCKPLTGPLAGLWRLRVGDYRVILDIQRSELVIVALEVGHRSRVYG